MNMTFWLIAGLVIIAVLSGVAAYYWMLVYRKQRSDQQKTEALQDALNERRGRNRESIVILARALLDDQVSLTEASIRINALLPSLSLSQASQEKLSVFQQLAEATAHIPILERWKALPRKDKQAFDKEREVIEAKYREFVYAAAKNIAATDILHGN
tara:strand:+ start:141 stop:611 length:471 start_codon:yes stop_codon:yes gene_type:complete